MNSLTFSISKPLVRENEQSVGASHRLGNYRARILVAEDDKLILQLLCAVLEDAGFNVNAPSDGPTAWAELLNRSYDLLVTDYEMPGLSGIELIERIRSANMNVPAILVSGTLSASQLNNYPHGQVLGVLRKPFCMFELLDAVDQAFQSIQNRSPQSRVQLRPHRKEPEDTI